MQSNYDFLEKCTKSEIIHFIKKKLWMNQFFHYSDVLSFRWGKKSEELLKKEKELHEKFNSLDAKKQDELSRQYNKATRTEDRIKIAELMTPYYKSFEIWDGEKKKLWKEQVKIDLLYESIDRQRCLERQG